VKLTQVIWSPIVTILLIHKTSNVFAMSQFLFMRSKNSW